MPPIFVVWGMVYGIGLPTLEHNCDNPIAL